MFTKAAVGVVALVIAFGFAPAVAQADDGAYDYTKIEFPPELGEPGVDVNGSWVFMSDNGLLLYNFWKNDESGGHWLCALVDHGTWTVLLPPDYTDSAGSPPNEKGEVALNVWGKGGSIFSDLAMYRNGKYTFIDWPGGSGNFNLYGLNNRGDICGGYFDANILPASAFVYQDGKYSYYKYQGDANTYFGGINNRRIAVGAGVGEDGIARPFRFENGTMTPLGDPPGSGGTWPFAINNQGVIVGGFLNPDGDYQGYAYSKGQFISVNPFNTTYSFVCSVTSSGRIAGVYYDSDLNATAGFIGTPKSKKK